MKKGSSCALLIALMFVSCSQPTVPAPVPCQIQGTVKSIDTMEVVADCRVTIAGQSVTTDANGFFSVSLAQRADTDTIAVRKAGYADNVKLLKDFDAPAFHLDLFLKRSGVPFTIHPEDGGTGNTPDGASVTIPSLAGMGITEDLVFSITNFNVSSDDLRAVPGTFATDQSGTLIYSEGMIDVDIRGATTGNSYSLAGLGDYDISIPITGDPALATPTIPLWYFNETTGLWIEEGTLTRDGDVYKGTVTHFSTWNADFKYQELSSVTGVANADEFEDGESFEIRLTFPGFERRFIQTAPDREFRIINLPCGLEMELTLTKLSTLDQWTRTFISAGNLMNWDLHEIPSAGVPEYYNVRGFSYTKTNSRVDFAWTSEPAGLTDVRISYVLNDDPTVHEFSVPRGTLQASVTNLETGVYKFNVQSVYPGGVSHGIRITIKINIFNTLTIDITQPEGDPDYINVWYFTDSWNQSTKYTGPIVFPEDTVPILVRFFCLDPDGNEIFPSWEGDVLPDEGYYTVMDGPKFIHCFMPLE